SYRASPSQVNAERLVRAHAAAGPANLDALLARYPSGVVAAEVWHARGIGFREGQQTPESLDAFQHVLALRDASDLRGRINDLSALSERYWSRDDHHNALVMNAKAYQAGVALGNPLVLSHIRTNLAGELLDIGDVLGAERALGDSFEQLPADDWYLVG